MKTSITCLSRLFPRLFQEGSSKDPILLNLEKTSNPQDAKEVSKSELESDLETVQELQKILLLQGSVVTYFGGSFSRSWHIEEPTDYPLIDLRPPKGSGFKVETECTPGFRQRFYTAEGARLYIQRYYEIRGSHLDILFPQSKPTPLPLPPIEENMMELS